MGTVRRPETQAFQERMTPHWICDAVIYVTAHYHTGSCILCHFHETEEVRQINKYFRNTLTVCIVTYFKYYFTSGVGVP
jgi:hypothetical protein